MEYADEKLVLSNLAHMEETLTDDVSGNITRQIIDYYEALIQAHTSQNEAVSNGSDWQPLLQIVDGMKASQRIVQKAWEQQHSKSLN